MKCSDISERQQQLLFQCYCKTVYNTNFIDHYPKEGEIICTRGDENRYYAKTDDICEDYSKYDGCPGVNVNAAPALSLSKVAVVAMLFSSLLLM
ncbi:hypothetical protein GGF46_000962 [Coemansia sp. RSA 552]|nr:hypothetical protein GGF46_000962 [Coemansia sp. RSA 552]